jgi:hypothetical protein
VDVPAGIGSDRPGPIVQLGHEPTEPRGLGVRLRASGWPWWVQVVAVYAGSRLLSALVLAVALGRQGSTWTPWWGAHRPSYAVFVARWWDGWWYARIAGQGYPATLPQDRHGATAINAWAFYPLYPRAVRVLQDLTGLGWDVLAPAFATVLGAVGMLLVHACVRAGAPRAVQVRPGLPLATVAVLALFPSAIVLGAAYTESLALALLAGALLLLLRRHYLWATVPVALLGFTRAVALPLVLVVLVHALARRRAAGRAGDRVPARQWASMGVLVAVAGVSGVAWPLIVGAATGVPDAYLRTQEAWRRPRPMTPLGGWTRLDTFGTGQLTVVALVLLGLVLLLASRSARRLGPELYAWTVGYLVYLAVVADLISSLIRFVLLAFPLAAVLVAVVPAPPRRARGWLGAVLAVLAVLVVAQVLWALQVWVFVPHETGFLRAP